MSAYPVDIQSLSIGLLIARLVVGLVMAAHGSQKLLGWFGGYGLNKTGEFFAHLGFRPGVPSARWRRSPRLRVGSSSLSASSARSVRRS
jgi:uncharacterized membrane protein YphA (DoxX/SURF4 family)